MGQFDYFSNNAFKYVPDMDSGRRIRYGQFDNMYREDREIKANGFDLAEGVGWETIGGYEDMIINGGQVRIGLVDEAGTIYFVIEGEKTTIGVWERIDSIN